MSPGRKVHSPKLSVDVFSEKVNTSVAADEFVCVGVGGCEGEGDIRAAIRGRDFDPPAAGLECVIDHEAEAKLVHVETQTALLIADEDHDEVQAEIGLLPVKAQQRPIKTERYGRVAHSA